MRFQAQGLQQKIIGTAKKGELCFDDEEVIIRLYTNNITLENREEKHIGIATIKKIIPNNYLLIINDYKKIEEIKPVLFNEETGWFETIEESITEEEEYIIKFFYGLKKNIRKEWNPKQFTIRRETGEDIINHLKKQLETLNAYKQNDDSN